MPRSSPARPHAGNTTAVGSVVTAGRSWLHLVGVGLLCAKVALVPLIFDGALDMPFVVPKALVSHGLAYLLAATIAALVIRHRRQALVTSLLHFPVVALVLVSSVATVFAVDPSLALFGSHARMLGLASILDFAVFYLGIVLFIRTRRDAAAVVACALAASAFVLG